MQTRRWIVPTETEEIAFLFEDAISKKDFIEKIPHIVIALNMVLCGNIKSKDIYK